MLPLLLALRRRLAREVGRHSAHGFAPRRVFAGGGNGLQLLLMLAGVACCIAMAMPQVHIVAYCTDLGYGPARGAEILRRGNRTRWHVPRQSRGRSLQLRQAAPSASSRTRIARGFGGFHGGGFGGFHGGSFGGFHGGSFAGGGARFGDGGFADRSTDAGFGRGGYGNVHNAGTYQNRSDTFNQNHPEWQQNASQY